MDVLQAALDISLCRAISVTPTGASRAPLPIRAGRIGASLAARAWRIDLRDHLIFPGLINAHEHLHINAVPPLRTAAPFPNSYAWIAAFQAHFAEPAVVAALQVPKALRLRHGALKNLLAGTTCVAHHDPWHAALDATDFPVALLRDYGWSYALGWPGYGPPVQQSFAATPADRPWLIHLAEGTDATAQAELDQLDRLGCLAANSVLVHGVGLRERDIDRVIASGAAVVWCPTSNHALLGRSLDPRRLCAAGRLTLGSDSRLSGARDLLDEMRGVAARGELGPRQLLGLATADAARILRLSGRGSLAPGARADLVIVEDRGGSAESSLTGIRRGDIRAVVRDGVPRIADPDFAEWFAATGVDAVPVTLDGKPKLLAGPLAEPALLALEPGLERVAGRDARARDATIEARCY
ncbi:MULTISPECIES: amidohydrolase family protein [unclassified Rhodanobacter]|uniref:amidohydrolase family protein n=1 Tax=unclassified Rhodanobacter TaxID=2621553 RepID=UPI001BDE31F9|nr:MULTISPECIES: amidohydrolase family protein [unclassified Rhodanobacter]MBT2144031.1 amidohydrolase family protein [Rhodanobacter sp. LX-99]MBT2146895.1 amidohydrolase family protein [Rhodanobacter sp. LX-100]